MLKSRIESNHIPPIWRFVPHSLSSLVSSYRVPLSSIPFFSLSCFIQPGLLRCPISCPCWQRWPSWSGAVWPHCSWLRAASSFFFIHLWKTREPHVRSHQRTHAEMCPRFKSPRTGSRRSYQVLMFPLWEITSDWLRHQRQPQHTPESAVPINPDWKETALIRNDFLIK